MLYTCLTNYACIYVCVYICVLMHPTELSYTDEKKPVLKL